MDTKAQIESVLQKYMICEYYFGVVEQIPFSDKVTTVCEIDCKWYGHSWACPPHIGMVAENIRKCRNFKEFLLFSTVAEVSDAWNVEACIGAKREHEALTREFASKLKSVLDVPFYILSTGCEICETCACPDSPCRHPEERLMAVESHGIILLQLAEKVGMSSQYGGKIAVYFSMVFFNGNTKENKISSEKGQNYRA